MKRRDTVEALSPNAAGTASAQARTADRSGPRAPCGRSRHRPAAGVAAVRTWAAGLRGLLLDRGPEARGWAVSGRPGRPSLAGGPSGPLPGGGPCGCSGRRRTEATSASRSASWTAWRPERNQGLDEGDRGVRRLSTSGGPLPRPQPSDGCLSPCPGP